MKIEIEIPDKHIENAIISGVEGPMTRAWAKCMAYEHQSDVRYLHLNDRYTGVDHTFTPEVWTTALQLMAEKNPYQFGLLLANKGDAITGDCLIQYAAFGEEKYG